LAPEAQRRQGNRALLNVNSEMGVPSREGGDVVVGASAMRRMWGARIAAAEL
jgi:hypothetical protein